MNLQPDIQDKLAAEYVLGTLNGPARRRFVVLLKNDAILRDLVADWQTRTMFLMSDIPAINPPGRVWKNICMQLNFNVSDNRFTRFRFWNRFGIVSTALAVLVVAYLYSSGDFTQPDTPIAYLADAHSTPHWILKVHGRDLVIKTIHPTIVATNQSLQLWVLPQHGGKPVSLGLLPVSGTTSIALPAIKQILLQHEHHFAVSVEPLGGSPTGLPTGPVVYHS